MGEFDDLFDRAIPRDEALDFVRELHKLAVSTQWVADAARRASHTVSRGRLNEVANNSMKGVLGAAKTKGPLRQGHLDKRMALRNSVLGGQATRIDTLRPPAFAKAAADEAVPAPRKKVNPNSLPAVGAVRGGIRGSVGGAIIGGIAGGRKGIARGALAGAGLGGVRGYGQGQLVRGLALGAQAQRQAAAKTAGRNKELDEIRGSTTRAVNRIAAGGLAGTAAGAGLAHVTGHGLVGKAVGGVLGGSLGLQAGSAYHGRREAKRGKTASLKLALAAQQAQRRLEPTADQVILAERTGMMQQAAQENMALRAELEQTQGIIQEHAQAAEQAQMEAQQAQEELAMAETAAQQQAMQAEEAMVQAQEQASMAQEEAQLQAAQAAAQADGKMRISIRLQQMRQQLADLASQDPVAEEGEAVDPIMTATQQGGMPGDPMADPAAAAAAGQDPAAAAAAGGAPPGAAPAAPGGAPAAAGGAAPAKPKAKSKGKDDKKDDKAPKTEIKIGQVLAAARGKYAAATSFAKAKGIIGRGKQLITGSRREALKKNVGHNVDRMVKGLDAHMASLGNDAVFDRHTAKQKMIEKAVRSRAAEHAVEDRKVKALRGGAAGTAIGLGVHYGRRGKEQAR